MCLVEDDLMDDLEGVSLSDPNCILIGLSPSSFCYEKLNDTFRLLMTLKHAQNKKNEPDSNTDQNQNIHIPCPLIAIHRANYYRDSYGELSLGPGCFVSALEEATGIEAVVVGKPSN